ncbi:hypothetical protein DSY14_10920 [Nocardiopsis sp. MG754419]|nr:hypothetical protein [Nocardiopsis sp. MG754419]
MRTFRPRRSLPAVLVGTVIVLIAVAAAAEVIGSLVGAPPWVPPMERVTEPILGARLHDPATVIASLVVAAIGLALLLGALVPGGVSHVVLRTDDRDLVVGLSRRGLGRVVEQAAREVDGVTGVRARVGRRTVRVAVDTPAREDPEVELRTRVAERISGRVTALDPYRSVRVRVRVHRIDGGLR